MTKVKEKMLGRGTVLPPGVASPVAIPLKKGKLKIKVLSVDPENGYDEDGKSIPSDYNMAQCEYPGGFIKNHQVKEVDSLCERIMTTLRGRHGSQHTLDISKAPKTLKAGTEIELEVDL